MSKTDTNSIKAVVFDMAGTTVDEGKTVYRCVKEAIARFGYEYSLEEVMGQIGGMNKKEGIRLLMSASGEVSEEVVSGAFELFRNKVEEVYSTDHDIKEKIGATDLFRFLKEREIKVVLDTGYYRSTADILIDRMDWENENLIDYSVTSDEVAKGRPEPLMIQKMVDHFELGNADKVIKVGDTRSDIEEGHNAGCCAVVGISSDMYSCQDLLDMGATHAIDELDELKEIITA
ncbi:MAG: HAD-IA family hydrolase [Roseivirga sp.]|nr:HAD-IA family hydrolase [Roseivirga sp.]